jgi:hypothetical protein
MPKRWLLLAPPLGLATMRQEARQLETVVAELDAGMWVAMKNPLTPMRATNDDTPRRVLIAPIH